MRRTFRYTSSSRWPLLVLVKKERSGKPVFRPIIDAKVVNGIDTRKGFSTTCQVGTTQPNTAKATETAGTVEMEAPYRRDPVPEVSVSLEDKDEEKI